MAEMKRVGSVDVHQDLNFTHTEWKVERIGWVIIALVLFAALLGLFGYGPLSKQQSGAPGSPLWIEYQSPDRYQAPTQVRVFAGPNTAQGGKLRLLLNRNYANRIEVERITPEPDSVEVGQDTLTYFFNVSDPAQPTEVVFDFRFRKFGAASAQFGIDQGPQVSFSQFVFP